MHVPVVLFHIVVGPHKIKLHVGIVFRLQESVVQRAFEERPSVIPVPVEDKDVDAVANSRFDPFFCDAANQLKRTICIIPAAAEYAGERTSFFRDKLLHFASIPFLFNTACINDEYLGAVRQRKIFYEFRQFPVEFSVINSRSESDMIICGQINSLGFFSTPLGCSDKIDVETALKFANIAEDYQKSLANEMKTIHSVKSVLNVDIDEITIETLDSITHTPAVIIRKK